MRGGGGSLPALRPYVAPGAEAAAAAGVEQLIATLDENLVRVIDLFRSLDADDSGTISKQEFRKGISSVLDVEPSLEELTALFDRLDPDASGTIEYRELHAKLNRREVRNAPRAAERRQARSASELAVVAAARRRRPAPPKALATEWQGPSTVALAPTTGAYAAAFDEGGACRCALVRRLLTADEGDGDGAAREVTPALAAALEACGDHFTFCPRCGSEGKRSTIVGEYREMMWRDGGVAPPKAAIAGRRPMLPREGRVSQAQL